MVVILNPEHLIKRAVDALAIKVMQRVEALSDRPIDQNDADDGRAWIIESNCETGFRHAICTGRSLCPPPELADTSLTLVYPVCTTGRRVTTSIQESRNGEN